MILNYDLLILEWITANLHHPIIVLIFYGITLLGNFGILWLSFALIYKIQGKKREAIYLVLALIVTSLFVDIIMKNVVSRPRPFTLDANILPLMVRPSSYSFPSGHTATSFACAMMIHYVCPKDTKIAFSFACLISISRLILCVHYPSDVLGGIIIGIIISKLVYIIGKRWENNNDKGNII